MNTDQKEESILSSLIRVYPRSSAATISGAGE
jgi:hypothetical protein